jgi:hypothetical protein
VLDFVATLQQAMSCLATAVFVRDGHLPAGGPYTLTFAGGDPVSLGGAHRIRLRVRQNYDVAPTSAGERSWSVQTIAYAYELLLPTDRELLAYHWHPTSRSPVHRPHLHLAAHTVLLDLTRAHPPTGLVTLPAILRFAVLDLDAQPRRADWQAVLDATETDLLLGGPVG